MTEDEEDANLLTGMKKLPFKMMSASFCSRMKLRKTFLIILSITVILIVFYNLKQSSEVSETTKYVRSRLTSPTFCSASIGALNNASTKLQGNPLNSRTRSPGKVLLVPKTSYSKAHKSVTEILAAHRIGFKSTVAGKNLPDLIKLAKNLGKYGVIIFEDFRSYLEMDSWNRDILDKYCQSFHVGIIAFIPAEEKPFENVQFIDKKGKIKDLPIINTRLNLQSLEIKSSASLLHLTKSGIAHTSSPGIWVTMTSKSSNFEAVTLGHFNDSIVEPTVMIDHGHQDNIPKVLFGSGVAKHWLYKLLFLDALQHVSNGLITFPLNRYVLVDIDDVFVGSNRFDPNDVIALLESQKILSMLIPGFRYNLGFSGKTYKSGTSENQEADEMLLENRHAFWWFPHMWSHLQPHHFNNLTELKKHMLSNKDFAHEHEIPVTNQYSVAPHHSGVYPVHQDLYEAWTDIWQIQVTSTEEYPHLRPAHLRRGFKHHNIQVLPRQTCGLFTKNLYYDEYPNGPAVLEKSIQGGELFQTIVNNPISIFMTHMPNYAFDRLAPYTFESVTKMIKCWTNLQLETRPPKELAELYFHMFPEEATPIWGNPCDDHRHMDIWSTSKSCHRLPDFLVIGPQKTGTTALYTFLQAHPSIKSNFASEETFEELQFFSNSEFYDRGIDWYMDYFPFRLGNNATYLFEKSATYFDKDTVPKRASRLLKNAKIIAILISPAKRAYSWYQHMRAHDDSTAMQHGFHEIISFPANQSSKALKSLQSRCLEPGKYASHLERWLQYYKSQQIFIVDGDELASEPIRVMNRLQHFLNIHPIVDYSKLIKYDKNKGFYCPITTNGRTKCLGKGKGRLYPPMEEKSKKFLLDYYRLYNEHLLKLLKRLGYAIPAWLENDLITDDIENK